MTAPRPGGKKHAVPGVGSALRTPARPPIPDDDEPAGRQPGQQPVAPPVRPAVEQVGSAVVRPADGQAVVPSARPASPAASQLASNVASRPASLSPDRQSGQLGGPHVGELAGAPDGSAGGLAHVVPDGELAGPPPVVRVDRVQLNSKIRLDLREQMEAFTEAHHSTLQAVIEAALAEYMGRRGWGERQTRAARRGR